MHHSISDSRNPDRIITSISSHTTQMITQLVKSHDDIEYTRLTGSDDARSARVELRESDAMRIVFDADLNTMLSLPRDTLQ